jgi:hypothetical protein
VRYTVSGSPIRTGICHCKNCCKESGSTFTAFAVWPEDRFTSTGETKQWEGRSFCPTCGSRLFAVEEGEAEVEIGTLDEAPTGLRLDYELWIKRREHWLTPVPGASQHVEDRPKG